ncbi:MAG: radical SAM protein, partial [Desulfobulbaceae bacterium]
TNTTHYKKYNGLWANVRTRYLDSDELQYQYWYQRQVVLSWWDPPAAARKRGKLWTGIWRFVMRPFLKLHYRRVMKKYGWNGRYLREVQRWERMNTFHDLEEY